MLVFYVCDPAKNQKCKGSSHCGECHSTKDPSCAKRFLGIPIVNVGLMLILARIKWRMRKTDSNKGRTWNGLE